MNAIYIICGIIILFIVLIASHSARVEYFNPAVPSATASTTATTQQKEKKVDQDVEASTAMTKQTKASEPAPLITQVEASTKSSTSPPTLKAPSLNDITKNPQEYANYFGSGAIITKLATGYNVTYPNGTIVSYNLKGDYIGATGTIPPPIPKEQSQAPPVPPACPDGRASGGFPCCPDGTPSDKGICSGGQQFLQ